jgi:putative cell wall-binding protein
VWDPTTGCGLPEEQTYDPETNPDGTRCTLPDYNVAALGRRDADGFANGINDHVGRQWGLAALQAGKISPTQFVDLNEKLGGFDIDFQWQPERSVGDLAGIERMYETGQLTYARNLAKVASIDVRTDDTYDFHSNVHRHILRARMVRSVGNHDSQVYWFETRPGAFGLPTPIMAERAFNTLDEWLEAIEADTGDDPLEVKVARNKPEEARDGCFTGGQRVEDDRVCEAAHSDNVLPRIVAGEPLTADVLKCQLKPLDPAEYRKFNAVFTDVEWARLQAAFPEGVCDFTQPGVGQQAPIAGESWLTLQDGPGGRPLAPPPRSEAVQPPAGAPPAGAPPAGVPVDAVHRVSGPDRVATAIALSTEAFPDGAAAAVLTRGDQFADALAASALAAELQGPVLLTASEQLTPSVGDELQRLHVDTVYLAGGPAALSADVEQDLRALDLDVVRVSGGTRYGTAAAVADEVVRLGGAVEQAIVVLGDAPAGADAWPDALAAANLAAAGRAPILLTRRDALPEETAAALRRVLRGDRVWIAGGTAAVGEQPQRTLVDAGFDVQRVAGPDRYATAAAVAAEAIRQGAQPNPTVLASGTAFADALAAGPAAAQLGGVLLLVHHADLDASVATQQFLEEHREEIDLVLLAGGAGAVGDAVADEALALTRDAAS